MPILRFFRILPLLAGLALAAQGLGMPQVRVAGASGPVRIQELRLDVQVVGSLATTTWDLTVYNPQDRVLEGELVFPLGDGQTVSRFALDVNGKLREGVVVEKAKGRQVFEAIVRRRVDPGLLEKTGGNAFRARVYPVPARGTRRIVLAYEQELPFSAKDGDGSLRFHLPLDFKEPIPVFSLKVQVHEQELNPQLDSAPLPGFAFGKWQRAFVAASRGENVRLNRPLSLRLPRSPESASVFLEHTSDASYFAVSVDPRLPRRTKSLPHRLLLLYDVSASARERDREKEFAVLGAYLKRIGDASVQLVVFRDEAEPAREFRIQGGNWIALRQALESAPLDGATALGRLDCAALRVDETLLISDGMNTLGPSEPRLPAVPLVALSSAAVADSARLKALSEGRGGEFLDLARLDVPEALNALSSQPPVFLRATYAAGSASELYPSGGQVLRGPFLLTGKLGRPGAGITLHFGYAGGATRTRHLTLSRESASEAPVARLWAQKKLAELQVDRARNAQSIVALGKAHGLVTDGTSLIVLEDPQDYARYGIAPPPELQEAVARLVAGTEKEKAGRRSAHLDQLLKAWQERQTWWETVFKPAPPVTRESRQAPAEGERLRDSGAVLQSLPASRPEGAPPASPAVSRAAGATADARMDLSRAAKRAGGGEPGAEAPQGSIEMKPWNPDTPYLKELQALPGPDRYSAYLKLRETHGSTPGFFLDVADLFERGGAKHLARRILSNLAELKLEDAPLLRVLGWRLEQLGDLERAAWVLGEVLRIREEEPQSRRDLALVLAAKGEGQRAAELLWEVVSTPPDPRFHDVPLIALGELNALIARTPGLDTGRMDPRFLRNLPVDIRVVLNWDTPDSDMDLHVVDPRGEECFYGHNRTALGGRLSADVTQGYGPEEFLLRTAIPGRYQIKAKFFGTRQQTVAGATTVRLELFLRYATGRVENKGALLRLSGPGRMVDVGDFVFGGK